MASLEIDPASGRYRVRFRYQGREYKRSLRTQQQHVALSTLGQVEETLRLLQLGLADLPPTVDPGDFIVSGARSRRERLPQSPVKKLADLFQIYQQELPPGAKEERTLEGERLHFKHLLRHLKSRTLVATISAGTIQQYVEQRSQDTFRKRRVGPETIKKEITTFRLVWNWARKQGYLDRPAPTERVVYPKRDEKPPFMTREEIRRKIERTHPSLSEEKELWESLYLTRDELEGLLGYLQQKVKDSFIYPMILLAAHTGMRRSELLRLESGDLDFEGRMIVVREKKRSRKHALSFRRVPMSGLVASTFEQYLGLRGSGKLVFRGAQQAPITVHQATHHFKASLLQSEWEQVRGFHVLRHSFASNAAAEGIDQRMIDEWMGHQTEEMRRRYRHLAPSRQRKAIDTVFG